MLAMLQDGRVIVVVFVAFLCTEANSTSSDNVKCRHCKEFIQSVLTRNNLLRSSEEKPSVAEIFEDIDQEVSPIASKLDFIKFCMETCILSDDETLNDDKNSIRSKREINEGIYKYFSPPFSHTADDESDLKVSEIAEQEDTVKLYENPRKAYQGYSKERRSGTGCECVKEQEESVMRLIEMVERYMEKIIEHFRGMLREEIKNQVLPERQQEFPTIGHQQNYFMLSLFAQNPPNPVTELETQSTFQTVQSTTAVPMVENTETHATSETKEDLTTTEMPQKSVDYTEETTTEVTIDLPEANVMRQSDDELPPDCEKKDQDPSQYLPALLQAFKPKNT